MKLGTCTIPRYDAACADQRGGRNSKDLLAENVLDDEAVAGDAGDDLGAGPGVEVEVLDVLPHHRLQIPRSHSRGLTLAGSRPAISLCKRMSGFKSRTRSIQNRKEQRVPQKDATKLPHARYSMLTAP
ncbi:hypothetical protein BHE74_00046924 [Ensete ventricosum]|nr:hypothetical protein GW17_00022528 [Ensete ventricosum]RWW47110.1 hypothetical protein BHE74_00046924 [Ensete ventricosum]RZS19007.1 hypothetical protein BHM03_00051354 [Ensete ventricosum]